MKARDAPRIVSRSRTSGARINASTRLTKLTKTMKNKELVRLTKNSAGNTRRITERSMESCVRGDEMEPYLTTGFLAQSYWYVPLVCTKTNVFGTPSLPFKNYQFALKLPVRAYRTVCKLIPKSRFQSLTRFIGFSTSILRSSLRLQTHYEIRDGITCPLLYLLEAQVKQLRRLKGNFV